MYWLWLYPETPSFELKLTFSCKSEHRACVPPVYWPWWRHRHVCRPWWRGYWGRKEVRRKKEGTRPSVRPCGVINCSGDGQWQCTADRWRHWSPSGGVWIINVLYAAHLTSVSAHKSTHYISAPLLIHDAAATRFVGGVQDQAAYIEFPNGTDSRVKTRVSKIQSLEVSRTVTVSAALVFRGGITLRYLFLIQSYILL